MGLLRQLAVAGALGALVLGGDAGPAAAQLVYGYVVDATTGERLAASYVAIFDTLGNPLVTGFAGPAGDFRLRAPGAGVYRLRASRLGYKGIATEPLDLRSEREVSLLVRLNPMPIPLPSVTVVAERMVARLRDEGFYDRKKMGFGHFITPDMLERHHLLRMSDLARFVPGAEAVGGTLILHGGQAQLYGRPCRPIIFVEGLPRPSRNTLNDVIDIADLLAAEVYPDAAGMPVQAGGLAGAFCGAIFLWTKR